jgi:hypothetical protein
MQGNPHQKTSSIPGIPKLKSNPQTHGQTKFFAVYAPGTSTVSVSVSPSSPTGRSIFAPTSSL